MTSVDWAALDGALLVFRVHAEQAVQHPEHGRLGAVVADVHVLDGDKEGEVYTDTLVFPKVLQSQLKPSIGDLVLCRLGQGHPKPGQAPPWTPNAVTGEDKSAGWEWYRAGRRGAARPEPRK